MSELEEIRTRAADAQAAFDAATERCQALDRDQAEVDLYQARLARDESLKVLQEAEQIEARKGQPTEWDLALVWVTVHNTLLHARYERDKWNHEHATREATGKTRHILYHSRQDVIRAYRRSQQEVTAS